MPREEGNTGESRSESDSPVGRHVPSVARYRPLGMMGNPFQAQETRGSPSAPRLRYELPPMSS